jgi:hypothetical protein
MLVTRIRKLEADDARSKDGGQRQAPPSSMLQDGRNQESS